MVNFESRTTSPASSVLTVHTVGSLQVCPLHPGTDHTRTHTRLKTPIFSLRHARGASPPPLAPRDLHAGNHGPSRWHGCRRAPARRPRPASSRSGGLHLRQRAERAAFSPRCGRTPEKRPKDDLRGTKITTRSASRQRAACLPRAARRRSPRPALEELRRPVAAVAPPGGRVGRSGWGGGARTPRAELRRAWGAGWGAGRATWAMVVAWVRGAGVWGRGEVGGGVWELGLERRRPAGMV